jgi:hypothetical protein
MRCVAWALLLTLLTGGRADADGVQRGAWAALPPQLSDGQSPAAPTSSQRQLLVRLPVPREMSNGTVWMAPNVEPVAVPIPPEDISSGHALPGPWPVEPIPELHLQDQLLPAETMPGPWVQGLGELPAPGSATPLFGQAVEQFCDDCDNQFAPCADCGHGCVGDCCGPLAPLYRLMQRSGDVGIGQMRMEYAPFEIEPAMPLRHFRFRIDSVSNFPWPDRAEYLWGRPGKGPPPDTGTDYQDLRFQSEVGSQTFSVATEVGLRLLDPDLNPNTAGLGDMNLGTKLVMLNGQTWKLTQVFRTYFNTGASRKGLGTGHISMEPGLLGRYRCTDTTYLHSELKFWFPIGGDPVYSGQVLRYGLGYSQLLFETDAFAAIHTGEFFGFWFLDGQKTVDVGTLNQRVVDVDGESAFQFYPGVRFVADTGGDLGLFEFGISGTFGIGDSSLYGGLLRFDFRFSY